MNIVLFVLICAAWFAFIKTLLHREKRRNEI